jgi:hypothetical protein
MTEFLVALPIDPMPQRSKYPQGHLLPLHVTVMHWFQLPVSMSEFDLHNELMELSGALDFSGIFLVSEKFDSGFGPAAKTPVHVLERNEKLNLLHTHLLILLVKVGAHFSEVRWIGAGYRPHAAVVGEREFVAGSTHNADRMVLIKRGEDRAMIVKSVYAFG